MGSVWRSGRRHCYCLLGRKIQGRGPEAILWQSQPSSGLPMGRWGPEEQVDFRATSTRSHQGAGPGSKSGRGGQASSDERWSIQNLNLPPKERNSDTGYIVDEPE